MTQVVSKTKDNQGQKIVLGDYVAFSPSIQAWSKRVALGWVYNITNVEEGPDRVVVRTKDNQFFVVHSPSIVKINDR